MTETKPDTNYLQQRLTTLGITAEQNTFIRKWVTEVSEKQEDGSTRVNEHHEERSYSIFDADEHGNICIHYFNLAGQPYRFKKEDAKQARDFIRKRLRDPQGDQKYHQEKGSPQFPFFPPAIISKYQQAEAIETLFVTEGEFKAFKGCICGLDIIGIPSIHGFYNGDVKGKLNEDIQELIIKCKVQKVVYLVDADLLTLKWEEKKDLSKRPESFYAAVKAWRESLQLLMDDEKVELKMCYFMHIETKYHESAKGLDDLLCTYTAVTEEIIADLKEFQFAKRYFKGFVLNDTNKDLKRIYFYLGLTDEQEFYKTYKDFIGAREFKFRRKRYEWDAEAREVKYVRHEDADKFMRIGPDWVKVITRLNKFGEPEEEIVPWKIAEITRDYKKFPDFLDQVQKYDSFINEPNWNGEYKRVINGCFNLCHPLRWQAKEGSIFSSRKFLKHLFRGEGDIILDEKGNVKEERCITGDPFTVALDYLTILIKHPKHMLPVPILVSQENGTGKSTFLKWLQQLFGSNMCILGNEQFKMKFNGHYITKFIIAIDEGFLEVDKKAEKERLKQLVTADKAYLENKGMNVREINYFGKLIICSNDADRVMKIEEGESRWFVVKVPVIPKEDMDPDLEKKLKEEMPAWLQFLYAREIHHPRVHRLWFDPEWFITDQMRVIVETTKNRVERVFEDWLSEQFMLFRLPVLRYSMKYLTEIFNDPKNSKYRIDGIELKAYLQERKHLKPQVPMRIDIPIAFDMSDDKILEPKIIYKKEMGRPYVFKAEEWLDKDQISEWTQPISIPELEQKLQDKKAGPTQLRIEENDKGYPKDWD